MPCDHLKSFPVCCQDAYSGPAVPGGAADCASLASRWRRRNSRKESPCGKKINRRKEVLRRELHSAARTKRRGWCGTGSPVRSRPAIGRSGPAAFSRGFQYLSHAVSLRIEQTFPTNVTVHKPHGFAPLGVYRASCHQKLRLPTNTQNLRVTSYVRASKACAVTKGRNGVERSSYNRGLLLQLLRSATAWLAACATKLLQLHKGGLEQASGKPGPPRHLRCEVVGLYG
jgi:hypothetical protein